MKCPPGYKPGGNRVLTLPGLPRVMADECRYLVHHGAINTNSRVSTPHSARCVTDFPGVQCSLNDILCFARGAGWVVCLLWWWWWSPEGGNGGCNDLKTEFATHVQHGSWNTTTLPRYIYWSSMDLTLRHAEGLFFFFFFLLFGVKRV
jgi:hypothetical protein